MFGEIIDEIVGAAAPVDQELALVYAVLDLVKAHVDSLGAALFDSVIGDAGGTGIVRLNGSCWLWMSHFCESSAEHGAIFGVVE